MKCPELKLFGMQVNTLIFKHINTQSLKYCLFAVICAYYTVSKGDTGGMQTSIDPPTGINIICSLSCVGSFYAQMNDPVHYIKPMCTN